MSSSWRSICRSPHAVFAPPFTCFKAEARSTVRSPFREAHRSNSSPFLAFSWVDSVGSGVTVETRTFGGYARPRRTMVRAANWGEEKSPYETLGSY
ncbi:hypothetical protein MLD38_033976 [Melastoma candidum]|uniref:Uncharacterized protein n=1 Tax=Melastoma candidum TaxID=119954 RepID=A0ACB9M8K9_9MYRT|nr:hypothetical protein MLD38_033976 [Melastoma candidum]